MEQYEVIFLDDDKETVLEKQTVNHGETVRYKGKLPTKEPVNGVTYTFSGWTDEEKMETVTENLTLIAKYTAEMLNNSKEEDALLAVSLENAENMALNATIEAGQKVNEQQKAIEKDSRTVEQIINDILENGKTEIGQDINKDNVER